MPGQVESGHAPVAQQLRIVHQAVELPRVRAGRMQEQEVAPAARLLVIDAMPASLDLDPGVAAGDGLDAARRRGRHRSVGTQRRGGAPVRHPARELERAAHEVRELQELLLVAGHGEFRHAHLHREHMVIRRRRHCLQKALPYCRGRLQREVGCVRSGAGCRRSLPSANSTVAATAPACTAKETLARLPRLFSSASSRQARSQSAANASCKGVLGSTYIFHICSRV